MFSRKTLIILLAANCLALLTVIWLLLRPAAQTPVSLVASTRASVALEPQYQLDSAPAARYPAPVTGGFGSDSAAAPTPHPQAPDRSADEVSPEVKKFLPLAFVDPDPADKTWDETRLATLARLRRDFANASKEFERLDPSSPDYQVRWKTMQSDFDNQYRAALGTESYLRYRNQIDQAPEADSGN